MGLNLILRKGTQTDKTQTDINMNAGVALAQAEFWPSWVSSWGQAKFLAQKAFSNVYAVIQVDFTYFLVYFHVFM